MKFLDITMLAADMGVTDFPAEHPDAGNFVRSHFEPEQRDFDLVLCDGQVLRNHGRAAYREHQKEANRLTSTQLALGLEHLRSGGTMMILLHKVEALDTVHLLHTFNKFASVRLYKHPRNHAKRSSFYMLATNINVHGKEAATAIERWKKIWKIATFDTGDNTSSTTSSTFHRACYENEGDVEKMLGEFGSSLLSMARDVWNIQADALAKCPFVK